MNTENRIETKKKFSLKAYFAEYTLYEKIWLLSISLLAIVMSILLPEDDVNGVSGIPGTDTNEDDETYR